MRLALSRLTLSLALALCLPVASVQAADPAKVDELLELMDIKKNVAQMQTMINQVMDEEFEARIASEKLTPAQAARVRATNQVMKDNFAQIFAWEELGPEYRRIYADVLTDAEVEGAIAYYRTPAGAAMLAKTPELMQRSMVVGQNRAREAMPRMQAELDRAMHEAKAPGQDEAVDPDKSE